MKGLAIGKGLFFPIFILALAVIALFYLFNLAGPTFAQTCVSQGTGCPAGKSPCGSCTTAPGTQCQGTACVTRGSSCPQGTSPVGTCINAPGSLCSGHGQTCYASCPSGSSAIASCFGAPGTWCAGTECRPQGFSCRFGMIPVGSCPAAGVMCCIAPSTGPGGTGVRAFGTITLPAVGVLNIGRLAANFLTIAFFAAALYFLIQVVIGGISWINAGGDPKALEAARGRITHAVIGLVIVVGAFVLSLLVTRVLGINVFRLGGISIN